MRKSVKVRKLIFEILLDICKNNSSYDKSFNKLKNSINLTDQERAMIYNISLDICMYALILCGSPISTYIMYKYTIRWGASIHICVHTYLYAWLAGRLAGQPATCE